jgi:hypothetical protein
MVVTAEIAVKQITHPDPLAKDELCFTENRRYSPLIIGLFCSVRCLVDRRLRFPQW